ncbi:MULTISPECIES: TolC family protein [unclassified Janthinobacterium]|uniref:TolC family protein n=1 Tax=unclassified Janthinobacterium TaxID=2610881 RepID=UPI00160716BC|nr:MULTISPECIES: TolC family protein [unclassified Janthinobacterium]MBB5610192.1 cobalt-zinc-cadmium efflux system outer membrane protein [Janthinobacterium sp. S3T4]MBB5615560.1 cobalt-zinc-cadmium efflux system outer membrane protein [Janthinobacterium sp. S3M3]
MKHLRRLAMLIPLCFSPLAQADAGLSDSLPLDALQRLALARNHDVRMSNLALQGAGADVISASAAPNPMLTVQTANINPGAGVGAGSLRSKTVDSTVRIDQLLERGGKRELRRQGALHQEEGAQADLREARRQLRIAVSQAYYDVLAASQRQAILAETAQLYQRSVDAAQKQRQAGDISPADVARLAVEALRAANDEVQARSDVVHARQALALLTGLSPREAQLPLADGWPTPVAFGAFSKDDGAGADNLNSDEAIAKRPDVMAAQARVAAALSAHKLALASRTRDVSVGVQAEHYPVSPSNPQGSGNSFGISLQVPLFLRYQYDGEIRSAQVALDAAQENLEQTRIQARAELSRTELDVRSDGERLQRIDDSLLPAAKKSAQSAEFAYQHGAMAIADVLDVRRNYRAVQLDALAARSDYAKALAAWQASIRTDSFESTTP